MATKLYVVSGDQYRTVDRWVQEIKRQLDQDGGSPLNPDAVAAILQQIIENRFSGGQNELSVIVDYDLSLNDMIAAGRYDWSNSDITAENFPINGKGKAEIWLELVHFDRAISTDEAIKELDRQDLRPAKIEELLAFGATYSEKQREFPIICLGSVWVGRRDRSVPCLDQSDSGRGLDLSWIGGGWGDDCRFLSVRKSA